MNILGLKVIGHDTGAALISKKRVVAIAEERLNRVKHSPNMFPRLAIDYCLSHLGLTDSDIDIVVIDQIGHPSVLNMREIFKRETGDRFLRAQVHVINHHDAHAASAFFCSPFDEAAVLVYDGTGEKFASHLGVYATETDTLYTGYEHSLVQIRKNIHRREGGFFPYTFGIGKLYEFISHYINFGPLNEGKLMGLAAYGDDSLLKVHPYEHWCAEHNGSVLCNSRITYPGKPLYDASIGLYANMLKFFYAAARPIIRGLERMGIRGGVHEVPLFQEIRLPQPKRTNEPLPDTYYASVAYAAQKIFEHVAKMFGTQLKTITRSKNLCVAGGCGLNIDANMNFLTEVGFSNIFIQPAASDTGIPLGLALYGAHMIAHEPRFFVMEHASLGRPYTEEEILEALNVVSDKVQFTKYAGTIASHTAKLVSQGKIIGWFQGGGEYGPRALGHRSIICDARQHDMRDVLNMRVKHREPWRPFAASVLRDRVNEFFEYDGPSPFMVLAANVRKEKQGTIPSVTHVDGTCRMQTVTKEANGRYYELINSFYDLTKVPLILNTSFNLGGEPIVESPADALRTFLATNIDHLVLEEYLVSKK